MTRREQAYNRKLQELIDSVGRLQDKEVARVMGILEAARKEVAAMVASTEWQARMIPQMKEAVDRAIETFRQRYQSGFDQAISNQWNAGIDVIEHPLQFAGIRLSAPEISRTALEILQGFSVDLIKGLSADMLKQINNQITLGVLGQKTPFEVMQAIGRNIGEGDARTLAARAEAITRTEMARVHSAAREARIRSIQGKTDPEITFLKKWISSRKFHPRQNHAALNGVMKEIDEDFPGGIPFPHAPGLPAKEVVNCG